MEVKKYLEQVAYVKECHIDNMNDEDIPDAYYSKFDDSYITFVGLEKDMKYLADKEITEELTHGVGFSPKDKKWYGWSHRAIYGFEVGSTCKKGDCHYIGSDIKEQEEDAIRFWESDDHLNVISKGIIEKNNERFFDIQWKVGDKIPNKKRRGMITGVEHFITRLGRGEWTAKTMEDAKQMAVDFNEGVS